MTRTRRNRRGRNAGGRGPCIGKLQGGNTHPRSNGVYCVCEIAENASRFRRVKDGTVPGIRHKFRARFAFGNGLLMAGEKLMGSECRLWSVARTQSQIKFNMYRVNPESEGLLAYWRFDEGEGCEFTNLADPKAPKAYLAKSISAAAQPPYTGEPEWVHGVRSDEN